MLERAGLMHRSIRGASTCFRFNAAPMAEAQAWIDRYRTFWEGSLANLETYVTSKKGKRK